MKDKFRFPPAFEVVDKRFCPRGREHAQFTAYGDHSWKVFQKRKTWMPTPFDMKENPAKEKILGAKNVLEIGCGPGRNFPFFMQKTAAFYTGVDPSEDMLKYFWEIHDRQKYQSRTYISTDFDDTVTSKHYDVVISTLVFQHIHYGRHVKGIWDVGDITDQIRKNTGKGTIWFLWEHQGEGAWINKWLNDNKFAPIYMEHTSNLKHYVNALLDLLTYL
jgi:SAM-dependent methyltransferase